MAVPGEPSVMVLNTLSGLSPYLNRPDMKLRGLAPEIATAATPLPSPLVPWQATQFFAKVEWPSAISSGELSGVEAACTNNGANERLSTQKIRRIVLFLLLFDMHFQFHSGVYRTFHIRISGLVEGDIAG